MNENLPANAAWIRRALGDVQGTGKTTADTRAMGVGARGIGTDARDNGPRVPGGHTAEAPASTQLNAQTNAELFSAFEKVSQFQLASRLKLPEPSPSDFGVLSF